jgi:hypothetical protein
MPSENAAANADYGVGNDSKQSGAVAEDDARLRLGQVLVGLSAGARAIRDAVAVASPPGSPRQALDEEEHVGHWLTRPQVKAAIDAAAEVEAIVRRLRVRMDPRCKGTLGERPSWMSPDQFDPCRCTLPRGHDGDHECEHLQARPQEAGDATH